MVAIRGSSLTTSPTQPLNEPKARSFGEIILSVLRALSNLGHLFSCFSSPKRLDQHELTVIADRDRPFSPSPTGGCPSSPASVEELTSTVFPHIVSSSPALNPCPYQENPARDAADDAEMMSVLSNEKRPPEYYQALATQSLIGDSQQTRASSPSLSELAPSTPLTPVAPPQHLTPPSSLSTTTPSTPLTPVAAQGHFNLTQTKTSLATANDPVLRALMGDFKPFAALPASQIQHNPHDQESFLSEFSTPYGEDFHVPTAIVAPRPSEPLTTASARLSSYTPSTSFEDDPLSFFETTSVPPAKAQTKPGKPLTEKQIALNLAREEKEEAQFQVYCLNQRLRHAEKGSRLYQSLLASLESAKIGLSHAERKFEEATASVSHS